MIKIHQFLGGFLIIVVLASCSNQASVLPTPSPSQLPQPTNPAAATVEVIPTAPGVKIPALTGDWQIILNQSGGVMGMPRTLLVSSSGDISLTDLRNKKTSRAVLSADEMLTLTGLVADSRYEPASAPSGCADCFIFDLEIVSGAEKFGVQMNQIELVNSGLQPLITLLTKFSNNAGK